MKNYLRPYLNEVFKNKQLKETEKQGLMERDTDLTE